ncbi:MAG TPA: cohesin domain-containing protein, partial [Feifaniaceae bacterium]|nr:cohesin domain-containing protein [Feifaniaceae bacterium]
ILVLSALVLVLCLAAPSAALADGEPVVRLSFGSASGEVGAEVDVPVLLSDCKGVDSVQFDINYDPAALSVVSVTPGDLFPAEYCITNIAESGVVRVACACALGLEGDGTLLTIRFKILSEAGSALTVTSRLGGSEVTYIDADYNQLTAYLSLENGGVSVGAGSIPGALVTPWVPVSPSPSPTAVPSPSPTPTATATQQAQTPVAESADASAANPIVYYLIGGLLAAIVVVVIISVVLRSKARKPGDAVDKTNRKER